MSVLNVAFYGSDELASNIAKKGDSRDVVSYVFKAVSYTHLTLPTIYSV